jgi:flagellar biosynthesis/type III secretory pathway M-ring protein FliF/YscJ
VTADAASNPNYTVTVENGTFSITKRSVTLTSATDQKEYDGSPLTNDEVTVSGDGFINGEGAAYDVTGSQTIVGSSENTFTYTLNEGTKAGNYNIETANGTLTVTNRGAKYEITAEANDANAQVEITEAELIYVGTNITKIAVTAEDGSKRTYKIYTTRLAPEDEGEDEEEDANNEEESAGIPWWIWVVIGGAVLLIAIIIIVIVILKKKKN